MEDNEYDILKNEMKDVFDYAVLKAQLRISKSGNTATPWKDFSIEHLQKRLDDEIKEYKTSKKSWKELLDVINISCFLYIAHKNDWIERSVKLMKS